MTAPCVLIVDDDGGIRDSLQDVLGDAGFEVATAENGQRAIEWLRAERRSCVMLLDLMMPVMDGFQVLDVVLGEALLDPGRIVVITADRDPVLPMGVDLLRKPMTVEDVVDAIRRRAT